MNEATGRPLAQAEVTADRIAVLLELAPLFAMLMPFVAILTIRFEDLDIETLLLRAAAVALASGLGWLKIGRPMEAAGIAVVRAGVLALLVWWAYAAVSAEVAVEQCEAVCDATNPLIPSIVPVVLVGSVFVLSTFASAAFVARTSRSRRASRTIATTPDTA